VQVLRFGGVVAVAVDDHWGAVLLTAMLRGGARLSNRGGIRIATPCVWDVLWDALRRHPEGAGQAFRGNDDMADLPRLNGVIRAPEQGQPALTCFAPAEVNSAVAMATSKFDGCVFEMEHSPWDGRQLRDCLQYMLNRAQIAGASLAPVVTPMARVPVNGAEMAQWQAKQALDIGCYGLVFPHISTVEEAANAVGACRYPRLKGRPLYEPPGLRGDGPATAARYWGLSLQEYYQKADVWPLNPQGEIFCILQVEDTRGVENLDDILTNVPGIGCILIGEGDLSQ